MNTFFTMLLAALIAAGGASAQSHPDPQSVTSSLLRSYPMDGSKFASPHTAIGLSFASAIRRPVTNTAAITVTGSRGEEYPGSLKLSADRKTLIFTPDRPFALGETVTVRWTALPTDDGGKIVPRSMSFTVRSSEGTFNPAWHSDDPMTELLLHPPVRQQGTDAAVQGLPLLTVINDDDPSDGRLYLASIGAGGTQTLPYLMILDKQASVLFSRQPGFGPVYDFVAHPNNTYSFFNAPTATYYILDSQYTRFDTLSAANGYQTDPHELRFHSDGSYDLIAVDPIPMDLRTIVEGGDSNAIVMDNLIQEFDKDGNLIFEWRALDHFKITDIQHEQNTGPMPVDFCHMNGIDLDNDGNLLLTSRHLDEITKIDRATGSIIWRFGGKNNQFTVSGDSVGFSHQHSIRSTPLGTYLLFDNGDYHNSGGVFSRAVEYTLDTVAKTAKQIWEFRHDPPIFTFAMGSVQRLDNGNTLIGWGQNRGIAVTEVGPFNRTVFELTMDSAVCSYRAYKFPDGYVHSGSLGTSLQPAMTTGTRIECTPNPVHDHAQIQFTSTVDGPVNIALYDGLGRKLCSVFEGTVSAGEHSNPLNMQGLAAGTYFVRIVSATGAPVSAPVLLTR